MKTDPSRTIAELKELRQLTGNENGAQRVAFTDTWARARAWLRGKLEPFCPDIHTDEAGNLWATLRGESSKALLIGGHIDSVPNGGWLDGCLGTLAGGWSDKDLAEFEAAVKEGTEGDAPTAAGRPAGRRRPAR